MAKRKPRAKGTVVDRASGRVVSSTPEELDATQPLLAALIEEAGWKTGQIVSRPNQWRVPASPSGKREWPVDVAIFDAPEHVRDPAHVLILCECKRPDLSTGIEQLKIYLDREPHARVGVWFNGVSHAVIYKTRQGYDVAPSGVPIPAPTDPLGPQDARPLRLSDLRKAPSLVPVFQRIRNRLATLDQHVNRDEEILPDISLLLLLKILDEQSRRFGSRAPLRFQIDARATDTAERMRAFLAEEAARRPELFGGQTKDVRFQIDDDSIHYVVETLQNYRLLSNDTDAVAGAFQVIRGKAYKGEEGQYFTPQSVVRVAVAAVDPKPEDRVIDPACGSGSFLATAMANVSRHIQRTCEEDEGTASLWRREWCTQQLFALDKDAVSVRLSKAYLSMLGDGSTHVLKADAVRSADWPPELARLVRDGSFDVVLTNPPFGTKLKVDTATGRKERYALSAEWAREGGHWRATDEHVARDLGLIFLERSLRLLRDGGRIAIVLPDTYLFSDSYGWLLEWLSQFKITHSINVPIEAFEPHCRAKTSVIVLEKAKPPAGHRIVGSICETFGEDKHGRPRYKFADGRQTAVVDDEMAEAAELLRAGFKHESQLAFRFPQREAVQRGVLVASYWWRRPVLQALDDFAQSHDCDLVTVGDLIASGELSVHAGHGSPSSHFTGRGDVPYVKVVDIKNWRVIENPKYAVPQHVADRLRGSRGLADFDLVTPTRASKNIGLFGMVMPWQKHVVLTREIAVWRVGRSQRLDPWLLLAMTSLKVVHRQFRFLVLMQMNREDLGGRFRELLLPIPRDDARRRTWAQPLRDYFSALVTARESYDALRQHLDTTLFVDRP